MIDHQIADNLRSVAVKNTKAAELAASIVGDYARIVGAISSRDADRAMDETRQHYESASRRLADRADLADVWQALKKAFNQRSSVVSRLRS